MKKIRKNIKVFFLCLAWLALIGHLLIPHDHHSSDLSGSKENNCPVSDRNTGHNHGLPIHCHAFNDLALENSQKMVPVRTTQPDDFTVINTSDIPYYNIFLITITDHQSICPAFHFEEACSLRAPPVRS